MIAKRDKPVRITTLEVENVKRVKAVALDCSGQALTIIGGRNAQGKTSILDAIMWTLGGDRFKPTDALREGADKLATKIQLTNGMVVERRGVNGALKVTSPDGKGGQNLLNEFVSAIALDLPKFMHATTREKANILLDLYPELGAELNRLNQEAKRIYDERHAHGVIVERKKKYAEEMPFHQDAPNELLTGTEMTQRLQDQLRKNAENDRLRREVQSVRIARDSAAKTVDDLKARLAEAEAKLAKATNELSRAESAAANLADEDTSAIQRELEQIDAINAKVRQNLDKARAEADAETLAEAYRDMTNALEDVRAGRMLLLAAVKMPLPDLTISDDGDLLYRARKWDGMSGAEQLRVAAAICASIKPECGFVLLDGLERMDTRQLAEFAEWLDERGLQAIGTRVSEGEECSIIIEDGVAVAAPEAEYEFK
jgi:predicted ATP-dependent endonuclease of OLD family